MPTTTQPLLVTVRVRPEHKHTTGLRIISNTSNNNSSSILSVAGQTLPSHHYDAVLDGSSSQHTVYTRCGAPLVDALFDGYSGCLFAYGQTGSGKTHSMLGARGGAAVELDGIIPQAATDMFRRIARQEADAASLLGASNRSQYEVRASFVEVYQGRLRDLLAPQTLSAGSTTTGGDTVSHEEVLRSADALLKLVAGASSRRKTATTGMNEHSSRSHALLTLVLEHRWQPSTTAAVQRSRTTRLMLVDLAGSESTTEAHAGVADKSGCHINLGLLALGRVTTALARGEGHIPYRASLLTRLLEPALGQGATTTRMLACVSDAPSRAAETLHTLQFGVRVAGLRTTKGKAAEQRVKPLPDPMAGDRADPNATLNRRAVWLQTYSHGEVFARVAGSRGAPLILCVHGSGPTNSSLQFNFLVDQLARRAPAPGFYHVAIDCPGYGRSPGDKQTVRSYPGALLADIVRSLGKRRAYCLIGSSQGACAVLNATLEMPTLALAVAVCHPVGHDVARYTRIKQPVCLLFDSEDAGHPISVGRRMHKLLPCSYWHEYAASASPNYLERHMATALLTMFHAKAAKLLSPAAPAAAASDDSLPSLTRVAGGVRAWKRARGRECREYEVPESDDEDGGAAGSGGGGGGQADSSSDGGLWEARLEAGAGHHVVYVNTTTGAVRRDAPPPGARMARVGSGGGAGGGAGAGAGAEDAALPLFQAARAEQAAKDAAAAKAAKRQQELAQTSCDLCAHTLKAGVVRLPACRHLFCACCVEAALYYHRSCPVCSMPASKSHCKARDEELMLRLAAQDNRTPHEDACSITCAALVQERGRASRWVLEVGNLASDAGGGRAVQTTFVRVVQGGGGTAAAIKRVDFNINPSYSKPTARVSAITSKRLGFTLERTLAFTYPCFATIHFHAPYLPPLHVRYYTQMDDPCRALRIVLQLPPSVKRAPPPRTARPVEYDGRWGDGWVRVGGGGGGGSSATVSYSNSSVPVTEREHAPKARRLSTQKKS